MAAWSVNKDYLRIDSTTAASIDKEVKDFILDEALCKLAIDAIQGKVPQDCFKNLAVFSKAVAYVRFNPQTIILKTATKAIQGKVSQNCFNNLAAFSKADAYDGFNPQTIILEMATKAAKDTRVDTDEFTFEAYGVRYALPKKCDLARDVEMFATLFLVRGNNIFKLLKTVFLSKDAKKAIKHKIVAYSIKSVDDTKRKERVVLSSKDITLGRVAASFPHMTLAIAKKYQIVGKANCTAIKLQADIIGGGKAKASMPHVLQHGLLPALLSKAQPAEEQHYRQFCYMFNLEQTLTLQHPNVKKMMFNEALAGQMEYSMKFVDAAINGSMVSATDRVAVRKGLFSGNESTVEYWVQAGSDAWVKSTSAATYTSLIMMLTNELN